jgi:hypothetical protein
MNWFNVSCPRVILRTNRRQGIYVVLWNLFRRVTAEDGTWWGIGLLQIERRHLAYVGSSGLCLAFLWLTGEHGRAPQPA